MQELPEYPVAQRPEVSGRPTRSKDLLGREMLDQRFAGMKQALEKRQR